jgi:hypothetical protein
MLLEIEIKILCKFQLSKQQWMHFYVSLSCLLFVVLALQPIAVVFSTAR